MVDYPEEENAELEKLSKVITRLIAISSESLARRDLAPDLDFSSALYYFDRTLKLFRAFAEADSGDLPLDRIEAIISHAEKTHDLFERIRYFSVRLNPDNPVQIRNQILLEIKSNYKTIYAQLTPIIAYDFTARIDFSRIENAMETVVSRTHTTIGEQEERTRGLLLDAETTLNKLKQVAQEIGVVQHAIHFNQEAAEHKRAATRWLIATSILATVVIAAGIASYIYYLDTLVSLSSSQSIQLALSKLVVFSVLVSGLIWSAKIYRAHRHNYVVNKHRQNALSTFEAFVKSTADEQTKSAVLLQATQCIFAPQHTGYVSPDADAAGYPQILEIVRGITNSSGKA